MTSLVAIPCPSCGADLYDRVRKYHLDVPCNANPCYNFKDGHWSEGGYCPQCTTCVQCELGSCIHAAEHDLIFGVAT